MPHYEMRALQSQRDSQHELHPDYIQFTELNPISNFMTDSNSVQNSTSIRKFLKMTKKFTKNKLLTEAD